MNSFAWIQFLHLIIHGQSDLNDIQKEREDAYKCIQRKECHSEWREDLQDWVIVPNKTKNSLEKTTKDNL